MYASELQELARKNPEKYNGKEYKIIDGIIMNYTGKKFERIFINEYGELTNLFSEQLFFSFDTQIEEVKQKVSFFEAISNPKNLIASADINDGVWDRFNNVNYTLQGLGILIETYSFKKYEQLINGKWYIK
jgi:hypothetical protein